MKFDKVKIEHITLALQDFKEKGLPEGFKASAYFDVEIEGQLYPPKPIMAYAKFHATGEKPTNNFSGGVDTPCFKTFERLGIPIIKKTENMNIDDIIKLSKRMKLYQTNSDQLFTDLNALTKDELNKISEDIVLNDHFQPVVCLRFLVLQDLINGNLVDQNRIDQLKNAINIERDISTFYNFSESYLNELKTSESSNMFKQWKNPFRLLFGFFYSKALNAKVEKCISQLSNEMVAEFELEKVSAHKVAFNGPQNYGSDHCWGAIYPSSAGDVKQAYQLFFSINSDGINAGLYVGGNLESTEFQEIVTSYSDWENCKKGVKELIPKWIGLNETLDFSFTKDEEKFKKRLKKLSSENLNTLFNTTDQLIEDLEISDNEKIVFSVPDSKQELSVQYGKRYCLLLKKNLFDFIAPPNYVINHLEHGSFAEKNEAWYYKSGTAQDVYSHYNAIRQAVQFEISRDNHTKEKDWDNKAFRKAIFDLDYRSELFDFEQTTINSLNSISMPKSIQLNQILFGPPGTGKTFHTINEAIKIADPEFYKIHNNDREQLKARFKLLSLNNDNESVGQIGFTTFHQSFSYEDFIEGIKPNQPKDGDAFLKYEIQEGVFKKICRLADDSLNAVAVGTESLISLSTEEYEKAHFYKMSLGNTQDESDNEIYEYCIENNCISLGFGNQLDFTGKDEKELRSFGNDNDLGSFDIQAMNLFSNYLKIGNYVVISYGNKYVRAVGKVTGNYEYREDSELPNNLHYKHFRSVEWIFTDEKISANEIYNKNLSMQTIYKLDKKYIKQEFFVKEKKIDTHRLPKNPKNYVLIVDEINRGNVSSVFGELITLIEKDKRAGADEELSVTLPYSKETFSVPKNVYIIGTMNTADRSIEALDTALRRRFSFREMPPKPELIKTVGSLKSTNGKLGDIDVVKILETINNRIEKLIDKDHKIGHSYFLNISNKQDLKDTFRDKVIPLLEEYFFGDFGKISLVLGSSFISKESKADVSFATSNDYDSSIANDLLERSVYEITSENNWDFKAIYE